MSFWTIVPVKPLRRGKSRLAGVLTEDERAVLNQNMLSHTLKTLRAIPEMEQILVISRDPAALTLARHYGAHTVREEGTPQLNDALNRATTIAMKSVARGVLILPADLPLMTPNDVRAVMEAARGSQPVVVIAPDRHRQGTNALLVAPPGLFKYAFGPDSFTRHCELARQMEARLVVCELPSLAVDVDFPEDLAIVEREMMAEVGLYEA